MTRPTIRDVARQAGVGIGTVSRVLNNSPRVDPATRQHVLTTIAEMGFKPNALARQLPRKVRIHNIGVITQPFVSYRAFAERLRGVQTALMKHDSNRELVLYTVNSLKHYDERLTTIVQSRSVEGLLIIDLALTEEQKEMLRDAAVPFVGINPLQNQDWPCVGTDNVVGGYMAAKHLLDYGHTQIAYVGDIFNDDFDFRSSRERYQGFQLALTEHGIAIREEHVKLGTHDYEVARVMAAELFALTHPHRPSAIFAMSDIQALACIRAANEAGLRVPDDVSVIGYDDLEMSQHIGLTTVRQHLELSGRIALQHLLSLLAEVDPQADTEPPTVLSRPTLPPPQVMVRKSTRRVS